MGSLPHSAVGATGVNDGSCRRRLRRLGGDHRSALETTEGAVERRKHMFLCAFRCSYDSSSPLPLPSQAPSHGALSFSLPTLLCRDFTVGEEFLATGERKHRTKNTLRWSVISRAFSTCALTECQNEASNDADNLQQTNARVHHHHHHLPPLL